MKDNTTYELEYSRHYKGDAEKQIQFLTAR